MSAGAPLPRFSESDLADARKLTVRLNQFATTLESRLLVLEGPLVSPRDPAGGEEVYAVTNVTEDRTYDADSTTLAEVADVLGTLLADLQNEGKLR